MAKIRIMKQGYGDQCLLEYDITNIDALNKARSIFNENMSMGGRFAFRIDGDGETSLLDEFDETAEDILFCPAIQGG